MMDELCTRNGTVLACTCTYKYRIFYWYRPDGEYYIIAAVTSAAAETVRGDDDDDDHRSDDVEQGRMLRTNDEANQRVEQPVKGHC